MAAETHFTPGSAADEVIELEFFPLVSDGPDRRWQKPVTIGLCARTEPHLPNSISAVNLYCFISQDAKLSVGIGERLDVYFQFQTTTNKLQRFLIYLLLQTLYMFQAVPPPIIRDEFRLFHDSS